MSNPFFEMQGIIEKVASEVIKREWTPTSNQTVKCADIMLWYSKEVDKSINFFNCVDFSLVLSPLKDHLVSKEYITFNYYKEGFNNFVVSNFSNSSKALKFVQSKEKDIVTKVCHSVTDILLKECLFVIGKGKPILLSSGFIFHQFQEIYETDVGPLKWEGDFNEDNLIYIIAHHLLERGFVLLVSSDKDEEESFFIINKEDVKLYNFSDKNNSYISYILKHGKKRI